LFEDFQKQDLWRHQHSPQAQAINKFYHPQWKAEDPAFIRPGEKPWRPPGHTYEHKRSPVKTRFTRQESTRSRDMRAFEYRSVGYSYPTIANVMAYSCRQRAHDAVARAWKDILTGNHPHADKLPLAPYVPRRFPPVDVRTLGIKVQRAGIRGCGCYLDRGERVAYVDRRQWCLGCAVYHAGLTWEAVIRDPTLMSRLTPSVPGIR
jgi:hypothetical protein